MRSLPCSAGSAGISPTPPWAKGGHSPEENLAEGLRVLKELTGADTPHIMVLSANLWSVFTPFTDLPQNLNVALTLHPEQ